MKVNLLMCPCLSPIQQVLNKLPNIHKTWHECYATRCHPNSKFQLCIIKIFQMGKPLAPIKTGLKHSDKLLHIVNIC